MNKEETILKEQATDEEIITVGKVVNDMVGVDKDGDAKAALTVGIVEILDEEEPRIIRQLALHNTFLSRIAYPGDFVLVQLEFKLLSNTYRESFCEMVKEFHSLAEQGDFAFFLTVASLRDDVRYIVSLECPLMCIQGYSDFSKEPTAVQVLFSLDGFNLYPVDYSLSEIRAEVGRELAEEEEYMDRTAINDINEQVKETYGINQPPVIDLGERKEPESNLDKHMRITRN